MGRPKKKPDEPIDVDATEIENAMSSIGVTKYDRSKMCGWGITTLNIGCSGYPDVAIKKGGYYLIIGGSETGKSWLCRQAQAEACYNPAFDDYQIVWDDIEHGVHMDDEKYFGKGFADRVESPMYQGDDPVYSETVEELYFHLMERMKNGPVFYVVDSMDALSDRATRKQQEKIFTEVRGGADAGGDYGGAAKAKVNSQMMPDVEKRMRETGSIVLIICQEKDNLNAQMFGKQTRFSGGRTLKYLAQYQLWLYNFGKIEKTVKGSKYTIGHDVRFKIEKNRMSGLHRHSDAPFYPSYGFHDIESMVVYLNKTAKHWSGDGTATKPIVATEFDVSLSKSELIEFIENNNYESRLQEVTDTVWKTIEEKCQVTGKRKYG